jgi:hypothetical protein
MLALCWTDSKDGRNRKQIKWVVQPDGLTPAQETRLSPDGHQDFGLLSVLYTTNLGMQRPLDMLQSAKCYKARHVGDCSRSERGLRCMLRTEISVADCS